jgi:hypothetical protein
LHRETNFVVVISRYHQWIFSRKVTMMYMKNAYMYKLYNICKCEWQNILWLVSAHLVLPAVVTWSKLIPLLRSSVEAATKLEAISEVDTTDHIYVVTNCCRAMGHFWSGGIDFIYLQREIVVIPEYHAPIKMMGIGRFSVER